MTGGPIYYIRARFTGKFGKFLAGFFSLAIIFALGFTGNMVQANSISDGIQHGVRHVPKSAIGVVVRADCRLYLPGRRRAVSLRSPRRSYPIMAVILRRSAASASCSSTTRHLPGALKSIFVCAFDPQADLRRRSRHHRARGHAVTVLHAVCSPTRPVWAPPRTPTRWPRSSIRRNRARSPLSACSSTPLCVLTHHRAGYSVPPGKLQPGVADAPAGYRAGPGGVLPPPSAPFGNIFVAICMLFFAFSTIIGWYFFGEANVKALFGAEGHQGLRGDRRRVHRDRLGAQGRSGVEPVRPVQRPDGVPQPDRACWSCPALSPGPAHGEDITKK